MAIKSAIPVGPLSITVGYIADNTTSAKVTTTGASTSMAAGNGTLSVAYVQTAVTGNDSTQMSAKYSTTLGGASLSIGYSSTDTNTKTNTNDITATISQSVGTGASVFAEFINRDGLATSTDESSAILLGSSFAF
jgi:predicted porin